MPTIEAYLGAILDDFLGTQLYAQSELVPEPEEATGPVEGAKVVAGLPTYTSGSSRRPKGTVGVTPDEVAGISKQVQQNFGVGTAGQWRSASNDAQRRARTGRKGVSDHVSGLAVDITGTPEKLDQVAAWAKAQPNVKYVLWRTKDHYDHVHISYYGKQG